MNVIAEILTIGDELCRGEVTDTNSSWMAARLWELGIATNWMTSCRDDPEDMKRALQVAAGRAQIVLVSGGLGPTEDDLTVDVVAAVMGAEVVTHEPSETRMRARFETARAPLTPNSLRQVRVPKGAEAFLNPAGIAPGFELGLMVDGHGARVFVMPGPPREMQAIFNQFVAERVTALAASSVKIVKRIYRVFGVGESGIAHSLTALVDGQPGTTLHYQVLFPETLVKIVVRDEDGAAAGARLELLDAELRSRLGHTVYAEGGETSLAAVLGEALKARSATLSVAESCTGGMLGSLITDVGGSSAYFQGGIIAYANQVKERYLGVRAETLVDHGAVSRNTVEEMAAGVRERLGTTYGLAITGVAGPDGGTPEKPVGTVHIAVAGPDQVRHKVITFPGARDQIRRLACYWAMNLLLTELRETS